MGHKDRGVPIIVTCTHTPLLGTKFEWNIFKINIRFSYNNENT